MIIASQKVYTHGLHEYAKQANIMITVDDETLTAVIITG